MAQYGKYNPANPNNTSSLFAYKEVPLTSSKVNRWNANIDTAFTLLYEIGSALLHQNTTGIIITTDKTSLQVSAISPAAMQIAVKPGWACLGHTFAGVQELTTLPQSAGILAPQNHPRWDLVVLNEDGELQILTGTESESPTLPESPVNAISLAKIVHRPGAAKILDEDDGQHSYLVDQRAAFFLGMAHQHQLDRSPAESPDGSRTHFTTQDVFHAGSLDVYLNGVLQQEEVDYAEDPEANGYTFFHPPPAHYRIQHRYHILHK